MLKSERDRTERLVSALTLKQLNAIATDTRLPGEIGSKFGYSAAVVLRIQAKGRQMLRQQKLTARVR
jgi:hypothetical protein